MMTKEIHSDLPIPPGEFLEEVLDDLGMGKDELARRMDRPAAKLSAIYKGGKAITPDTALQLEKVTGVPAHIWTGLETEYRLTLARLHEQNSVEKLKNEIPLVTKYCFNSLVKYGYVQAKTKSIEKVQELQKFFGVTSLLNLEKLKRYEALYKQNLRSGGKVSKEALLAWLRMGELKAYNMDLPPFDAYKLKQFIPSLREMTNYAPEKFQQEMNEKFYEAGVALVIVPHLPKTYAHGATFWLNEKPVLMNTIRGGWADIFWFSLFHEIGHILLHNKNQLFIERDNIKNPDQFEEEANSFAGNNLIDKNKYRKFIMNGSFYKNDIVEFAELLGIHPGIVVGRLQHDMKIKPNWNNGLREKYTWN